MPNGVSSSNVVSPAVVDAWRQEAADYFQTNQAMRGTAERTLAAIIAVIGIGASLGAQGSDAVVIPLPAVVALLLSHMFEQYADLTVIGMARLELERRVNEAIGGPGLIYETVVADIRKVPPLVGSLRYLRYVILVLVAGGTIAASVIAAGRGTSVWLAFAVGTVACFAATFRSWLTMNQSNAIATKRVGAALDASRRPQGTFANAGPEGRGTLGSHLAPGLSHTPGRDDEQERSLWVHSRTLAQAGGVSLGLRFMGRDSAAGGLMPVGAGDTVG